MPAREPNRPKPGVRGLLDRVIHQRRALNEPPPADRGPRTDEERITALERRVDELEALLEGLQDSIHREMTRQHGEIAALENKTRPAALARALAKFTRDRGI